MYQLYIHNDPQLTGEILLDEYEPELGVAVFFYGDYVGIALEAYNKWMIKITDRDFSLTHNQRPDTFEELYDLYPEFEFRAAGYPGFPLIKRKSFRLLFDVPISSDIYVYLDNRMSVIQHDGERFYVEGFPKRFAQRSDLLIELKDETHALFFREA